MMNQSLCNSHVCSKCSQCLLKQAHRPCFWLHSSAILWLAAGAACEWQRAGGGRLQGDGDVVGAGHRVGDTNELLLVRQRAVIIVLCCQGARSRVGQGVMINEVWGR